MAAQPLRPPSDGRTGIYRCRLTDDSIHPEKVDVADTQRAAASPPVIAGVPSGGVLLRRYDVMRDAPLVPPIMHMLHRAYRKQVDMGLRPLAGRQDADVTLRRCSSGECYLAIDSESTQPIGVIILNEIEPDTGPPWFMRQGVQSFSQLAVDPSVQGRGVGRQLLEVVERRAKERNAEELALSMAEPDDDLRRFYQRHGYRIVGIWKWPYTNYQSLIMSKTVVKPG